MGITHGLGDPHSSEARSEASCLGDFLQGSYQFKVSSHEFLVSIGVETGFAQGEIS